MSDATLKQRVRDLALLVEGGMSSFDPPVAEDLVHDFERRSGIELPADYRWFITQVASGGPGPYNGLLPFRSGRTDTDLAKAWIDPVRWNETDGDYLEDEGEEEGSLYQGVLAVADAGCGSLAQLVLVGPHRGEVWLDLTAGSSDFRKVGDSYCQWYGAWVDAQAALIEDKPRSRQEELRDLESALAARGPNEDSLCRLLFALGAAGDSERFAYYLDRATEIGALSPFSAATIINDALSLSCAEAAERLLDRRLRDGDDATTFLCLRALVRVHRGDAGGALDDWHRAQAAEDFKPPRRCAARIAATRLADGALADALSVYIDTDGAIAGPPSEVADEAMSRGLHALALVFCEAFQARLEELALDEHVDTDAMLADVHAARVIPLLVARRAPEAEEAARVAEELGAAIDWQRLAMEACEARAFQTSLRFLDRCSCSSWWTANLRGCCLEGQGKLDEALASFEESLASRNWIVPFENRAYTYIRQGNFDAARQLLDQVEAFAPEFPWTHYHRAALLAREGAMAEAEIALHKALSLGLDPAVPATEPYLAALRSV